MKVYNMKVRVQLGKSVVTKHQSLAHDAIIQKGSSRKASELEEAVEWCKLNDKRGWSAVKWAIPID